MIEMFASAWRPEGLRLRTPDRFRRWARSTIRKKVVEENRNCPEAEEMFAAALASYTKRVKRVNSGRIYVELEPTDYAFVRHRTGALSQLCSATKFSKREVQLLYRGFKEGCPTGIISLEKFKEIYTQFFPQGDPSRYAVLVFNTFDRDKNGHISFDEFVVGLSVISRGSLEEKLRWVFSLYDTDRDGFLRRGDVMRVVSSLYDMMGSSTQPRIENDSIETHVDFIFDKMDENSDGVITLEEFLTTCIEDSSLCQSLTLFGTRF